MSSPRLGTIHTVIQGSQEGVSRTVAVPPSTWVKSKQQKGVNIGFLTQLVWFTPDILCRSGSGALEGICGSIVTIRDYLFASLHLLNSGCTLPHPTFAGAPISSGFALSFLTSPNNVADDAPLGLAFGSGLLFGVACVPSYRKKVSMLLRLIRGTSRPLDLLDSTLLVAFLNATAAHRARDFISSTNKLGEATVVTRTRTPKL